MTPDLVRAATLALETLIRHRVAYAPVDPLPILKATPGVLVLSYADIASTIGVERSCVLHNVSSQTLDATTVIDLHGPRPHYLVAYNRQLPTYVSDRALARELGHIILGHDGSRPEPVRTEEALCFSRHLLCPRPLFRALLDAGVPLTRELLATITGCTGPCQDCLRDFPGLRTPPELNRLVRGQFAGYVDNLLACLPSLSLSASAPADLGTYMDMYEE
jgi:hypothetical protein